MTDRATQRGPDTGGRTPHYPSDDTLGYPKVCRSEDVMHAGLSGEFMCDTNFEPMLELLRGERR